jgi:hypothetical protein
MWYCDDGDWNVMPFGLVDSCDCLQGICGLNPEGMQVNTKRHTYQPNYKLGFIIYGKKYS